MDQESSASPDLGGADVDELLHAAIDIGTNSIHMIVARAELDGGFEIVTTEKEMVRLGRGSDGTKALTRDSMDRTLAALERMVGVSRSLGAADIAVVATSAVREGANRQEFCDEAEALIGVEIDVISGVEEARLIHLGVLQALPVFDRRRLVVDIGGGSTEFVIGEKAETIEARSMRLGAIRLTQRFFPEGVATPEAVDECRQFIRSALAPMAYELSGHQPETAIGCSGTIETLAEMVAARRGERPRQMNGFSFSAKELDKVVRSLVGTTAEDRRELAGLEEKRVDIILGGAFLLAEIFSALGIEEFTVSEYALREGVLFDRLGGTSRPGLDRLADLRRSNVERLARQLDTDPEHAFATARLAVQLFDRTTSLHGLGPEERELLWSAAAVHNVGLFISHSSHHKHSYYVVRNSEHLTGFTEHEVELMALVARYHRKSHPSSKHAEYSALGSDDQRIVRILAGMLRIAIGLNRRHSGAVQSLRVHLDPDQELAIEPVAEDDDLEVELYAARARAALLSKALGVKVVIRDPKPATTGQESS